MAHILDRPVWSALTSRHASLAVGNSVARRYPASIVPFAAARDDSPESLQALVELAGQGDRLMLVQPKEIDLPDAFQVIWTGAVVQMIADGPVAKVTDERIMRLGQEDAADMLALAKLTKPGPFTLGALALGEFFGVRINGALIAMGGERMKQDGHTEMSGVCTHPDFRGQGLGRLMSLLVMGRIRERGETPYLHALAENIPAIRLYEDLGFKLRSKMTVTLVVRRDNARAAGVSVGHFIDT